MAKVLNLYLKLALLNFYILGVIDARADKGLIEQKLIKQISKYNFQYTSKLYNKPNILSYASSTKNGFYYYNMPIIKLLDEIQSKEGIITLECRLFLQLVNILYLDISKSSCSSNFELAYMAPHKKIFNSLYLALLPENPKILNAMQSSASRNKGQWLYKLDFGLLGLGDHGALIADKEYWTQMLINGLLNDPKKMIKSKYLIIKLSAIKLQKFNKKYYDLITNPDNWKYA
jgi:hypothetical protein